MTRSTLAIIVLLLAGCCAFAQERPLSPPERPPIPLTNADQERARSEELKKKKKDAEAAALKPAAQIKVPAALAGHHISSGNPTIDALVQEAASRNGLDPCLILSVMRAESGFNRGAVSVKGASGLMQLMPATASRFGV